MRLSRNCSHISQRGYRRGVIKEYGSRGNHIERGQDSGWQGMDVAAPSKSWVVLQQEICDCGLERAGVRQMKVS